MTEAEAQLEIGNTFYIIMIVVVLIVAFVWIGGIRWVSRFIPGLGGYKYQKVGEEDAVKY